MNTQQVEAIQAGLILGNSPPENFYAIGLYYANGKNGSIDYIAAHQWLNIAAAKGYREAALLRAELSMEMSAHEVAEAQKHAREWLRLH